MCEVASDALREESTVDVLIWDGELESKTEAEVYGGQNRMWLGGEVYSDAIRIRTVRWHDL